MFHFSATYIVERQCKKLQQRESCNVTVKSTTKTDRDTHRLAHLSIIERGGVKSSSKVLLETAKPSETSDLYCLSVKCQFCRLSPLSNSVTVNMWQHRKAQLVQFQIHFEHWPRVHCSVKYVQSKVSLPILLCSRPHRRFSDDVGDKKATFSDEGVALRQ